MLSADLWGIIVKHITCTKTLLRLRCVNKVLREQIPRHVVTGVPLDLERLLWKPDSTRYGKIHISEHEDIEGALADDGKQFWAWVYTDPIRLIQYDVNREGEHVSTFKMTSDPGAFLWIKIATNGLICMLTTSNNDSDEEPIFLSVLRQNPDQDLEVVVITEVDRKHIMRHSVFNDDYHFSRNSIQCFSWKERTFIIMLPLDQEGGISLMEINGMNVKWTTWKIPCEPSRRIGCIRQVRNLIYIIPGRAGSVHAIDLSAPNPHPSFLHTLPHIPNDTKWFGRNATLKQIGIASMMDVSENGENFVIHVHNMQRIFHLTKTSIRPLEKKLKLDINSFAFIGNNAVVCFIKASTEYRLYNLTSQDFVRSFHFAFIPHFSLMGDQCIWSVGPSMSVYRQIAAPESQE
jgi:hypothetical protein